MRSDYASARKAMTKVDTEAGQLPIRCDVCPHGQLAPLVWEDLRRGVVKLSCRCGRYRQYAVDADNQGAIQQLWRARTVFEALK